MKTELPLDKSANRRPAVLIYSGLESEPCSIIYLEDLVAERKEAKSDKPAR